MKITCVTVLIQYLSYFRSCISTEASKYTLGNVVSEKFGCRFIPYIFSSAVLCIGAYQKLYHKLYTKLPTRKLLYNTITCINNLTVTSGNVYIVMYLHCGIINFVVLFKQLKLCVCLYLRMYVVGLGDIEITVLRLLPTKTL